MQTSFLQSSEWADFKKEFGWVGHWVKIGLDKILVLERPLAFGLSFLYAPELEINQIAISQLVKRIKTISQQSRLIFFRLEILNEHPDQNQNNQNTEVSRFSHFGGGILETLRGEGFVKAFEEVQPEWRQMIDLQGDEEAILAQMKPKGRYNINVAKRQAVRVVAEGDLDHFYSLYRQTAKRHRFGGRPLDYFQKLGENFPSQSEIFLAYYQNQPVAGVLVMFWQSTATYLYGASSVEHRAVMAPYLLHWRVIQEAKKRGCKRYDLGAVAPITEIPNSKPARPTGGFQIPNPRTKKLAQKYAGITRFKQQFGGEMVHMVGSYDLIFKPVWYRLFSLTERLRRR